MEQLTFDLDARPGLSKADISFFLRDIRSCPLMGGIRFAKCLRVRDLLKKKRN